VSKYDIDRGLIWILNGHLKRELSLKKRSLVGNIKKSASADVDKRCVRRDRGPSYAIIRFTPLYVESKNVFRFEAFTRRI
jgi:hypothetical protein